MKRAQIVFICLFVSFTVSGCWHSSHRCGSWYQEMNPAYQLDEVTIKDLDDQNEFLKDKNLSQEDLLDSCNTAFNTIIGGDFCSKRSNNICSSADISEKERESCVMGVCHEFIISECSSSVVPEFKSEMKVCEQFKYSKETSRFTIE